MKRLGRRTLALVIGTVLVLIGGVAFAAWLSSGSGFGSAAASTVAQVDKPDVLLKDNKVTVSWDAVSGPVDRYDVIRHDSPTSTTTACEGINGTSCVDEHPAAGEVQYGVVARVGDNWKALESPLSAPFTFDTTGPEVSVDPASSEDWRQVDTQEVRITATDDGSGLDSLVYKIDGVGPTSAASPVTFPLPQGDHVISYTATDEAGNVTTGSAKIRVDNQAPSLSASVSPPANGSDGWYVGTANPTVTLSASDSVSRVATIEYQLNEEPWAAYPASGITTLPEGNNTVRYRSTDNAGNVSRGSQVVKIDRTAPSAEQSVSPSIPDGSNGWYKTQPTVRFTGSDALSELLNITFSLDGSAAPGSPTTAGSATLQVTQGSHTVASTVSDEAGNTASTGPVTYKFDNALPSTTISPLSSTTVWRTSNTVTFTASDANGTNGSGVAFIVYKIDRESIQTITGSSGLVNVSDGTHSVTYHAVDAAGNAEGDQTATIKVDASLPTITGLAPASGNVKKSTAWGAGQTPSGTSCGAGLVCADLTDMGSGIATVTYTMTSGSSCFVPQGTGVATPLSSSSASCIQTMSQASGTGTWRSGTMMTLPNANNTTYTITVTATDAVGNSKQGTITINSTN